MAQRLQQRIKLVDCIFKQLNVFFFDVRFGQVEAGNVSHHRHEQLLYIENGFTHILTRNLSTCQT